MPTKRKSQTSPASTRSPKLARNSRAVTAPSVEDKEYHVHGTFTAHIIPSHRPRGRTDLVRRWDETNVQRGSPLVLQAKDFFEDRTRISITPGDQWAKLPRYKTCGVPDVANSTEHIFLVGDDVLVKQETTEDDNLFIPSEIRGRWVGRILEIRAADVNHVYLLINWYNRPEDLPGGRAPHHSMNELLVTNSVDIIEAYSVDHKVTVESWVEADDTQPSDRTFFWRQCVALEYADSPRFSKLKEVCICNQPSNPDKLLVNCANCETWLHDECLIAALADREKIARKSWERVPEEEVNGDSTDFIANRFTMKPDNARPWTLELQVADGVFVSKDRNTSSKFKKVWSETMRCLKCNQELR